MWKPRMIGARTSAPTIAAARTRGAARHERAGGEQRGEDQRDRSVHVRSIRAVVLGSLARAARCDGSSGTREADHEPLADARAAMTARPVCGSSVTALALGLVLGELGLLARARRGRRRPPCRRRGRCRRWPSTRSVGFGSRVSGRRRAPKTSVVAGGVGSTSRPRGVRRTWRRSESTPKRGDLAAVAHEAAQALQEAARQPAHVAGQDDAAVVLQARAAVAARARRRS